MRFRKESDVQPSVCLRGPGILTGDWRDETRLPRRQTKEELMMELIELLFHIWIRRIQAKPIGPDPSRI
jgi:hypothetical protein